MDELTAFFTQHQLFAYKKALLVACTYNQIDIVIKLLKQTIYSADDLKKGFDIACSYGHLNIVKLLEQYIHSFDDGFKCAYENNQYEIVQYLLLNHIIDKITLRLCFFDVAHKRHIKLFKLMIPYINNLNIIFSGACITNDRDIIDYVIQLGCNNWNEGLKIAVANKYKDIVKYMITKGANNCSQVLPELIAYISTHNYNQQTLDICKLLIRHVDWNQTYVRIYTSKDEKCKDIIHELSSLIINTSCVYCTEEDTNIVQMLLNHGTMFLKNRSINILSKQRNQKQKLLEHIFHKDLADYIFNYVHY